MRKLRHKKIKTLPKVRQLTSGKLIFNFKQCDPRNWALYCHTLPPILHVCGLVVASLKFFTFNNFSVWQIQRVIYSIDIQVF